jgi:hypothetical protein
MDIQIRFEDGETQERDAESPVVGEEELTPPWTPAHILDLEWVRTTYPEKGYHLHLPGRMSFQLPRAYYLKDSARVENARVWRITGGWGEGEPLTGEWQSCRVETNEEQIERLTRELAAAQARLARVRSFSFCEGALSVIRSEDPPGTWAHHGRPFPDYHDMTLDEAISRAEEWERDLGYHLPAEEVLRRCKAAAKAAGWEACAETSDKASTVFRPDPNVIDTHWVSFPRGSGWEPKDLRLAASEAVNRLHNFGIQVDLSPGAGR